MSDVEETMEWLGSMKHIAEMDATDRAFVSSSRLEQVRGLICGLREQLDRCQKSRELAASDVLRVMGDEQSIRRRAGRMERVVQAACEYVDAVQKSNLTGHEFPDVVAERFSDLTHSVETLHSEGVGPGGLAAGGLFAKCRQYLDNLRVEMDADDPREAEVIGATRTLTEILDRFTSLREQLEEVEEERRAYRRLYDQADGQLDTALDDYIAARRRADQLEEEIEWAIGQFEYIECSDCGYGVGEHSDGFECEGDRNVRVAQHSTDRLRSALDSREDEGADDE